MWSGQGGSGGGGTNIYGPSSQNQNQQKHDIFVGNLAFSTTEEQLHQVFTEIGRVIKVRMVSDLETGKPRGFAFVEFEDPQAALSAIRNMNDYELNGRKLRVNFSNSSHLETLANQLGMDMTKKDPNVNVGAGGGSSGVGGPGGNNAMGPGGSNAATSNLQDTGTMAVSSALKNMSKGEMYDVIAKLKQIADSDPDEARKIISGHPQLPEALLFLMSQLDMIKTPLSNVLGMGVGAGAGGVPGMVGNIPPPPPVPDNSKVRSDPRDPRAKLQQPPPAVPVPPAPPISVDPRGAISDPRRAHTMQPPPVSAPPPPMNTNPYMAQQQQPPPGPPPQPMGAGVAGLDPALVQQVMSLTPAQISQLPPEKQNSILALQRQITNARGM